MSRKPSDASGMPHVATVRRDSPFPTAAIALIAAVVALMGLALFSPLRGRLFAPPPPARMPETPMPPPAPAPPQVAPAPPAAPTVVETPLTLMPATPPAAPAAPPAPPALTGEAALIEALRVGQLGMASGGDLSRWTLRWSEANGRGVPQAFLEHMRMMDMYVIRKDFTFPDGLNGAHAAIFILERGVPYPRGNPGHSGVLDMASGACRGASCHYLTER